VSDTLPTESPDAGRTHQEHGPAHPVAGAVPANQPVKTAMAERPLPPKKTAGQETDRGSQRLRADVDRLTPLFVETLHDIEQAGLTEHYQMPLRQAMRAYMTVMDGAWEALAEERLSEVVSGPGYQLEVAKLHQWLLDRKQRCAEALAALRAKGASAPRPAYAWRSRVKLYRQAINAWEQALDRQGDAYTAGQGLFRMHGYYGLTALRSFELWALTVLRWATVGVTILVILAYLVGIPFMQGITPLTTGLVLGLLGLVSYYIIRLVGGGSAPILAVVGYALAPRQQVSFTVDGVSVVATAARRRRIRLILEIWCALVLIGAPVIWVLAVAGLGVLNSILSMHGNAVLAVGDFFGNFSLLLVLILPLSYLFFLPFVIYTQVLLSRDLGGHFDWEVPARRYPLRLSIILLPFEIVAALVISITLRQLFTLQDYPVLTLGSFQLTVSTVLYLASFLLPYLFFIDLPYRYGVDHWRTKHLKELRSARRLAEEEIARLPLQGEDKEDLHELEYHLRWLEYYQAAMAEVSETEEAPFSVERRTSAILLATPLPLILAALQDIQSGQAFSQNVFDLVRTLIGGK
jgi:hypothetical protein